MKKMNNNKYKEVIDQAIDDHMYNVALDRKDEEATLTLNEVFKDVAFDFDDFIERVDREKEDIRIAKN